MALQTASYENAAAFLGETQSALEANEALNCLLLGICLRLVAHPDRIEANPTFKTVCGDGHLLLAAVMTPPFNIVLADFGGDADAATMELAETLVAEGTSVPGVLGTAQIAESFARAWSDISGQSAEISMRQRAFELRDVRLPRATNGRLRPAAAGDLALVADWCYQFMLDAFGEGEIERARQIAELRVSDGAVYLWEDGRPVSTAMKTRPTTHGISISFVYTPPELRKRGYATACVAELSRLLLEEGKQFCSLFTDLANPTSNHIYQEIGFRPIGDFDEYRFRT